MIIRKKKLFLRI